MRGSPGPDAADTAVSNIELRPLRHHEIGRHFVLCLLHRRDAAMRKQPVRWKQDDCSLLRFERHVLQRELREAAVLDVVQIGERREKAAVGSQRAGIDVPVEALPRIDPLDDRWRKKFSSFVTMNSMLEKRFA